MSSPRRTRTANRHRQRHYRTLCSYGANVDAANGPQRSRAPLFQRPRQACRQSALARRLRLANELATNTAAMATSAERCRYCHRPQRQPQPAPQLGGSEHHYTRHSRRATYQTANRRRADDTDRRQPKQTTRRSRFLVAAGRHPQQPHTRRPR